MRLIYFFTFLAVFTSCDSFLDAKSDLKLSTLDSKESIQALLDGNDKLNKAAIVLQNASDEYYITDDRYNAITNQFNMESYIWHEDTQTDSDWRILYNAIYVSNLIIDNLENVNLELTDSDYERLKSSAKFYRAHAYSHLLQIYCDLYDKENANEMIGVVIRENSDFLKKSTLSSLEECYSYVINDLLSGIDNLEFKSQFKTRPSKQASLALLARIYLYMGEYEKSFDYAEQLIKSEVNPLINYNEIDVQAAIPFSRFNKEVIFYSSCMAANTVFQSSASVSKEFYEDYDDNDLRKILYFQHLPDNEIGFKGSYNGSLSNLFDGIAWDEVFLIKAEAAARLGNFEEAMKTINIIKENRWDIDNYLPYTADNSAEALKIVLEERKKQLFFRGNRFVDIKRYNKEGRGIRLKRTINGEDIELQPGDKRYIWKIPKVVKNWNDF